MVYTLMEDKMTPKQKKWCKEYEQATAFEPLMDDFVAGNESFEQAARKSRAWFENWSNDALRGIPEIPE